MIIIIIKEEEEYEEYEEREIGKKKEREEKIPSQHIFACSLLSHSTSFSESNLI